MGYTQERSRKKCLFMEWIVSSRIATSQMHFGRAAGDRPSSAVILIVGGGGVRGVAIEEDVAVDMFMNFLAEEGGPADEGIFQGDGGEDNEEEAGVADEDDGPRWQPPTTTSLMLKFQMGFSGWDVGSGVEDCPVVSVKGDGHASFREVDGGEA